jgi:hypothetical protein
MQNPAKTRVNADGSWLAFAPRVFLQIFIMTTLTYRLRTRLAFRFAQRWHGGSEPNSSQALTIKGCFGCSLAMAKVSA